VSFPATRAESVTTTTHTSSDRPALKARGLSHTRASLTIARKLARRSYHVLHDLGPAALDPIPTT
jgi:ABC-type phosphate transport system ATPase subunit